MFDPKHLEGASSDLVRSMFKVGPKAAELEREKLQTEIQKERSEIRRKRLENRLKMSDKAGGKGGPAKNPKKAKREPEADDDDFLEDLVAESDPKKQKKPTTYTNLKPGGFVTKAEDRKGRLEKRRAKQETKDDDDDDDDDEETEQEKLEWEAGELTSQLKKAE